MMTKYAWKRLVTQCIAEVITEEGQPEPYDAETDTFAPSPRERTKLSKLELTPTGQTDDWSRPVYTDQNGKVYVDINLGQGEPAIHTVTDEGEPEYPVKNFKIAANASKNQASKALCPRCKNNKPGLMKRLPDGRQSCTYCHWEENDGEPSPQISEAELRVDKLSNAERRQIHDAFKKAGVDGNGRFEKKEHGLGAITQALSALGLQLDMVSGDMIMGDKGMRTFIFRRANDQGQDPYTEKPEIINSRIVFNWERMNGPTHQYPNSPSKFEIQAYAS